MTKTVTVIHCWSAPRSRSTALLYTFEARGDDCVALDEPLYREFLRTKGDRVVRPYLESMLTGVPPEGEVGTEEAWSSVLPSCNDRILKAAEELPETGGVVFAKQIVKYAYLYDFNDQVKHETINLVHKHFFLIREPFAVLSSWKCDSDVHGNNLCIEEIGYTHLMSAFSQVEGNMDPDRKFKPIVIDSDDLVSDPKSTLEHLCASLGIPFRESMLSWKAGPHKCDGPFASYWYHNVHKTDGWVTKSKAKESGGLECIAGKRYRMLDPRLNMALKACVPIYEFFQQFTESYKNRGPPAGQKIYEDPRNEHLVVWVGSPSRGRISPRLMAGLNPFDSAVEGGDAVWEGMRVHDGKIPSFEEHLDRLLRSAKALAFENVHTKDQIMEAIFKTLAANCMRDDTYIRVTLTRGEKSTSSLDPKSNIYGTTLIILPEWKPIDAASDNGSKTEGIELISASKRRHPSSSVLSNIQSNNMITRIMPKIQANEAGAADAIILDADGYVSETSTANIFMVDSEGVLLTPHEEHCVAGVARANTLALAEELGIPCTARRISLTEFFAAEEVFTASTMGGLTSVATIDTHAIGSGKCGPVTEKLQVAYKELPNKPGFAVAIPKFT